MKKINLSVLIVAAAVAAVGVCGFMGQKTVVVRRKRQLLGSVCSYTAMMIPLSELSGILMEQAAKEYEKETGIRVTLDVRDAKRNQITQNSRRSA